VPVCASGRASFPENFVAYVRHIVVNSHLKGCACLCEWPCLFSGKICGLRVARCSDSHSKGCACIMRVAVPLLRGKKSQKLE